MNILTNYLNILFDPEDSTCYALNPMGYRVYPITKVFEDIKELPNFVCINALDGSKDNNPTADWHRADLPRRADVNVIKLRSFLIEADKIGLEEQADLVDKLKLPYSTATFSGGKSIHFIISLTEPLTDINEYKQLACQIFAALGGDALVDTQNKNPSRLSRFPEALREGKKQELLDVRDRVNIIALKQWLRSRGIPEDYGKEKEILQFKGLNQNISYLRPFTQRYLQQGAPNGSRNKFLYSVACDFAERGYDESQCIEMTEDKSGLDIEEMKITIRSAYNRIIGKGNN